MAKRNNSFHTLVYDGNTARRLNVPLGAPEEEIPAQPRVSEEELDRARSASRKLPLREQQRISLVAIAGFALVAMLAVAVLASYIQLNSIYARTVAAQSTLTQLEGDYAKLEAEDQEIFDNARLQKAADEANLVKPGISQQVYVELSDPDNAVVYHQGEGIALVEQITKGVKSFFGGVGEYFN